MKALQRFLESQERHFTGGGKLERFYPLFEAMETLAFTPASVTKGSVHVRDALDLKHLSERWQKIRRPWPGPWPRHQMTNGESGEREPLGLVGRQGLEP